MRWLFFLFSKFGHFSNSLLYWQILIFLLHFLSFLSNNTQYWKKPNSNKISKCNQIIDFFTNDMFIFYSSYVQVNLCVRIFFIWFLSSTQFYHFVWFSVNLALNWCSVFCSINEKLSKQEEEIERELERETIEWSPKSGSGLRKKFGLWKNGIINRITERKSPKATSKNIEKISNKNETGLRKI